jgi:methionyl-tRNA synthetase
MAPRFYVTTPLYYINDVPHLGSAYTTIAADVLARYHRLRGEETRFLTGTDEHGLKIQRVAVEHGMDPQAYADGIAEKFRATWPRLGCAPDDFIRTTEARHKRGVEKIWTTIKDRGHIYLGHYEGLYCVGCEAYYTEKELAPTEGLCPIHKKPVETVKEESYFFRLSSFQDKLLAFYEAHPDFVRPLGRLNEVKSFVKEGLQDLSVSRTTFKWGIPVPGDERHVMYVWFDALSNYLTALQEPEDNTRFWASAVHLVGKDILRFHAIFWPAFLMAAGIEPPQQVFAHGFLTYCGEKMSKSLRNTIGPVELAEAISPTVGVDTVRYCLMRAIAFGQDGDFSIKDVLQRYESELGNTLGNLLNRVLPFTREVLPRGVPGEPEAELLQAVALAVDVTTRAFDDLNPTGAITAIWGLLAQANTYINDAAPWVAKKQGDLARIGTIMAPLLIVLEVASVLLAPVMPSVAATMREQLGLAPIDWSKREALWPLTLPVRPAELVVKGGSIIFPRFEPEKIEALIKAFSPPPGTSTVTETTTETTTTEATPAVATPATTEATEIKVRAPIEAKAPIEYADFAKMDLRVGVIVSAEKVKKKDKLLDLRVDTGDAAPRRIVAGLALAYTPEQILGKRVVVLCNLAPRDFGKGLVSEGMILAAEDEASLKVLGVDGEKVPGAKVS